MGLAMEVVDTFVTAGGAQGFTATAGFPGDVLSVRNFDPPAKAWLCDIWADANVDNQVRIRSPKLHDNVSGISFQAAAATTRDLLSEYIAQQLYAQDALIAEATSEAAETDCISWLVYYEDLPGSAARLKSVEEIAPRVVNLVNVEVDLAAPGAVGTRSASLALNSLTDLLIANTDYAILGYMSETLGQSIGIRGPDTGNLRLGGPCAGEANETRDWFIRIGKRLGKPCIPIINSANKAGTLIDHCQSTTLTAQAVTLCMAELSG